MKKRFWEKAEVTTHEQGFGVALDGRLVKTPAKAELAVPKRALAQLIAAEWDAQTDQVNPETMPVTRWANAAIDKVSRQKSEVISLLAEYGGSDLLCYRAETPTELFERQKQAWDPVLDWAKNHHQAPLVATRGIVPVTQPNQSLCNLKRVLERFDSFQIAAFHDLVVLSGSLVLALAVTETELDCQQAWKISRIDEDWQENLWGADEEAQEAARIKQESFTLASKILQLLR